MKANYGYIMTLAVTIVLAAGCYSTNDVLIISTDGAVEDAGLLDDSKREKDAQGTTEDGALSSETSQTDAEEQEDGNTPQPDAINPDAGPDETGDGAPLDVGLDGEADVEEEAGECKLGSTCECAEDLGEVFGDQNEWGLVGPPTKQETTNSCSRWLQIRVTEESSLSEGPKVRITLVSDPSTQYELRVRLASAENPNDPCGIDAEEEEGEQVPDNAEKQRVALQWKDRLFTNDDRQIAIEVRHIEGLCDDDHKWTLTVEGNED